MLFDLPNDEVLYEALLAKDESYEGRAFVCVSSTRIFCRLSCKARKPKPENCSFFDNVAACIEAGYRPCKKCHPLDSGVTLSDDMRSLVEALEGDPSQIWREGDIRARGLDPSTIRRKFKQYFGMSFLEMARQRRIQEGFGVLMDGGRVIDAQYEAGFDSPSAFRSAFAKWIGINPSEFQDEAILRAFWFATDLGPMIAVCDPHHLHLLEFVERKGLPRELQKLFQNANGEMSLGRYELSDQIEAELSAYFAGERAEFTLPLKMHGTPFMRDVWRSLQDIPAGQTRSYSEIAKAIDNPNAVRAVARANGTNQIAIVIPCHRVIGADGSMTGYGGGIWRKKKLIEIEMRYASIAQEQL